MRVAGMAAPQPEEPRRHVPQSEVDWNFPVLVDDVV
jgi:hypothetical protein